MSESKAGLNQFACLCSRKKETSEQMDYLTLSTIFTFKRGLATSLTVRYAELQHFHEVVVLPWKKLCSKQPAA
ncbi:unnamed protein product, partial [Iphiclides podalirius]